MKKKPYWIEVDYGRDGCEVILIARNNVSTMFSSSYKTKREANQMARRLAKNLGLEVRQ